MQTTEQIKLLDHGYIKLIETWGDERRIIEAARMSTAKGFNGWGPIETCSKCGFSIAQNDEDTNRTIRTVYRDLCDHSFDTKTGDEKLLKYLWDHKHATPFEMAGLVIEVKAPIFVFRQWHRHRTQCLAPGTMISFDAPKSKHGRRSVYKLSIEELWQRWQPTVRKSRPERQTNALRKRQSVQRMQLRCMNEDNEEITHTRIVDVIKGDPKPMVQVTTSSGRLITATLQHRFMTSAGWMTLEDAIENRVQLALQGTTRNKPTRWKVDLDLSVEQWRPVLNWEGLYSVSNLGRVRGLRGPKTNTVGAQNYDVVSLSRNGKTSTFCVHRLVLDSFVGPCPMNHETRHINNNRGDNRLTNLAWGSSTENASDRVSGDRQQRLVTVFEEIVEVESVGSFPTYDLTVEGPFHNFIADGYVVHNSYNEMSARYTPLPNENYMPTVERCMVVQGKNKQARGATDHELTHEEAITFLEKLSFSNDLAQACYEYGLSIGIPKELARLPVPVSRYSKMRASGNLRNMLAFMTLRSDSHSQEEIRVYSDALGQMIERAYPRVFKLWSASR